MPNQKIQIRKTTFSTAETICSMGPVSCRNKGGKYEKLHAILGTIPLCTRENIKNVIMNVENLRQYITILI